MNNWCKTIHVAYSKWSERITRLSEERERITVKGSKSRTKRNKNRETQRERENVYSSVPNMNNWCNIYM